MKKKLWETAVSFSRFTNVFTAKVFYFEFKTLNRMRMAKDTFLSLLRGVGTEFKI